MSNQAHADSLARLHTAEAMGIMVKAMRGEIHDLKPEARLRAAELILDRGHGRAVQAIISVPARQASAMRLAAMSSSELLRIAARGRGREKGGPIGCEVKGTPLEGEFTVIPNGEGANDFDPCE